MTEAVDRFVLRLLSTDRSGTFTGVAELLASGWAATSILTDVVGPAQVEIGERWLRNEITVADEHAASAITDAVITMVARSTVMTAGARHAVVLTPEGEWHGLPARIVETALRLRAIATTYLGTSIPAAQLHRFLRRIPADVIAVSCTTTASLPGALAVIDTAHHARVPVIVGGAAWGEDGHRATVLGADAFVSNAEDAADLIDVPLSFGGRSSGSANVAGYVELAVGRSATIDATIDALHRDEPAQAATHEPARRDLQDRIDAMLQAAEISTLVKDTSIFDEWLGWHRQFLNHRNRPDDLHAIARTVRSVSTQPAIIETLDRAVPE